MEKARPHRLEHLDMLRGACALLVVVSHLRSMLIVPYAQAERHGPAELLLFTLGGLGHESVIVFFALSGYLVGGSTLAAMRAGRFSFLDYGVARLSRLWTVLVPALILTALLDFAGGALAPPGAYRGAFAELIFSGPTPAEPASHSLSSFIGNLLFLQTIVTPVFGADRPLWSLANEAWYYLVFPLVALGYFRRGRSTSALCALAGLLALAWLPVETALLGLPWLAGALAADHPVRWSPTRALAASAATVAMIGVSHHARTIGGDILLGCVVAFWLRDLAALGPIGGLYARAATGLSNISYTLYAVHFPLVLMLWFWLLAPVQSQPGALALMRIAAFLAVALAYATLVWFLFERRTDAVRGAMRRALGAFARA
jgi:peptidoglycan/LPS O-acetylase OafA/YrhL